ncbi:maltose permease Mal31p [[Candida] jaroonii]|uniref:Maltose permease Mal31p n=1 Tax=[Candida] jaroonii TaxID=467808 RepID=A0ACA9YG71_9ASCO|nr:maltose permease Mal31p [[Candida] jaroonii]
MNKSDPKPSIEHIESNSIDLKEKNDVLDDVQLATDSEHDITLKEALKVYPMCIFWGIIISSTIIMEGYDVSLLGNFIGYPSFQKKYGRPFEDHYELTGPWQVGLSCASSVGAFFGVLSNGFLIEKFGHRKVIMFFLVWMTGGIFIPFFAPRVEVLLVGQIFNGIPWGVFATMGPTYSSEIMPVALRGYMTAFVNLCWATGQLLAGGILKGLVSNTTEWGYRIPFALQWVFPIPLIIMTYLAPDSPWWLIRSGKEEEAAKSLARLWNKKIHHRIPQQINLMKHTNELEKQQHNSKSNDEKGWRGYLQCFQGTNLRRTEIVCVCFIGQILAGSSFAYQPSYFFRQAGLDPANTYKLNLGTTAISFTGCIVSWLFINKFGRRRIYVTGYFFLTSLLLLIGVLAIPKQTPGIQWTQCGIVLVWVGIYATTIGPLTYTIISEMSATRLRAQSIALARNSYNIISLLSHIIQPYLLNPGEADLKGKTAFFWFGTAFPTLIWSYFRLPESKDRTYEELDILFDRKISARKFASTELDYVPEVDID